MAQTTVTTISSKVNSTSLMQLTKSLVKNRHLILQMVRREILGRYKGSIMGLTWSLLTPVLMLIVYTFVFSVVFKSRWGGSESKTLFAMVVFVGIVVLNLFNEVINRSPSLILSNANYVKKVVFPIEILPVVTLGAALFHCLINFGVLFTAYAIINGYIQWTVMFIPIVLFPLILIILGLSWGLAALGVYLRDVNQTIGIITMMFMFLSPVFYPITAVPDTFQPYIMANPLSFVIEQIRELVILGNLPNWYGLLIYSSISVLLLWLGYAFFQKTRNGFADVV